MLFCSNFESLQAPPMPPSFNTIDYSQDHHNQQLMMYRVGEISGENDNNNGMVVDNYMPQIQTSGCFYDTNNSFDKMSFGRFILMRL
jgi:hypothetical protein